ncbi:HD domain-containing protein [Tessaracoccus flavus]|uniref:HD domain-containing protein n=1 Tax=Tessaracoccus flavus TaxID=1610493 RepID=UPI00089BEA4D|nr:hypothetical protein [Tessaracoccus flavus]SDZ03149.1 Predicted metal-dependent phosphohydrolase, HD superfamily [Tessaracoccus flavus]
MVIDGHEVPASVFTSLRQRWAEPHRVYHSASHLADGLKALDRLGGQPIEVLAFWGHDAVHTNTTPDDERASAVVMEDLLAGHLPLSVVEEVRRLILLTAGHSVEPGDDAGARLCDADLSGLGADWEQYARNVQGIRAELPDLSDEGWREGRAKFLAGFLERDRFYSTERGRALWEKQARANLTRELEGLT